MHPLIVVIGSSNTDMVVKANHLPAPGETVLGGSFLMNAGGKGANQAIAAARLGGNVTFIAKTGNDIFGKQAIRVFDDEGIDTTYIISDPEHPSGVALISVDAHGENCIVVASGANAAMRPADLIKAQGTIMQAAIVLMQLEIPVEVVEYVTEIAATNSVKIILNPAPACSLTDFLLSKLFIITPNKSEAEMLSGIKITDRQSAEVAARKINERGAETVIITLGSQGAVLLHNGEASFVNAPVVNAVDTTAAGDIFNGALVVAIAEGKHILAAVEFACKAAAFSVTKMGAQSSAPYRNDLIMI